jgi:Tol biopolymer transport system component
VDLWLHDIGHGSDSRLTFGPSLDQSERYAVWSPDGNHLAFESSKQIYQQSTKASGQYEPLDVDARVKYLDDWSSDGRYLIEQSPPNPQTGIDIWVLPLFGDRKAFPYLHNESNESQAKLSPDGRLLAYVSDESKRAEVYVVTFPKREGKSRVSTGGGDRPVWSRDGKELYFVSADQKMTAVTVKPGIKFDYGAPQPLFPVHIAAFASFDIAKDGRFLIPVPVQSGVPATMNVIVNWATLLSGQRH